MVATSVETLTLGRSRAGIESRIRLTRKLKLRIYHNHFNDERWRLMKSNIEGLPRWFEVRLQIFSFCNLTPNYPSRNLDFGLWISDMIHKHLGLNPTQRSRC